MRQAYAIIEFVVNIIWNEYTFLFLVAMYNAGLHDECPHCLKDCFSITYTAVQESQIPLSVPYQDDVIKNLKLK